jgi:hypothetical protein
MTVMCLNSPPGQNTAIILLGRSNCDIVFSQYLAGRDSKDGYGPGAVVALVRPNHIHQTFGDQRGIPIIYVESGLKLVDPVRSGIKFPTIPRIEGSPRLHGFFYPFVKLKLLNANIVHTKCCGYLCDSIGMKNSDGEWRERCPCYVTQRQLGSIVLDLDFSVSVMTNIGGDCDVNEKVLEKFSAKNFTSRNFTHLVTVNGFPISVTSTMLAETCADSAIFQRLENYLEEANRQKGFSILGWTRRGRTKDQAVVNTASSSTNRGQDVSVQSSGVTFHITHIKLNCEDSIMKNHWIDVKAIIEEYRVLSE